MQADKNILFSNYNQQSCCDWTTVFAKLKSDGLKFGILLATYGSASHQGSSSIKNFQAKMEQHFKVPVRIAYTSAKMRTRLAHAKTKSDSVLKALQKMNYEKFTHIAVQSLHLIPGIEYIDVLNDVNLAKKTTSLCIKTGLPLVSKETEVLELANTLLQIIPNGFCSNDKLIWMGHGTPHKSEKYYQKLAKAIHNLDQRLHIVSISGSITIEDVLASWKNTNQEIKNVWLLPLLTTIGRHALHDMAGDDEQSCKYKIMQAGFNCTPHLHALAESELIRNIWIDRLCSAIQKFK